MLSQCANSLIWTLGDSVAHAQDLDLTETVVRFKRQSTRVAVFRMTPNTELYHCYLNAYYPKQRDAS